MPRLRGDLHTGARVDLATSQGHPRRWGTPDWAAVQELVEIQQPTLIAQGDADIMIPVSASYLMAGLIPRSRIKFYPDDSHGSIFQHAEDAAAETLDFLNS